MKKLVLIVIGILLFSCKSTNSVNRGDAVKIALDTLLQDKISIRALVLDHDKVWYAADQSRFGCIDLNSNQKKEIKIISEKNVEFRSIAQTKKYVFILNVGNPALLYKISKIDLSYELVYQENHDKGKRQRRKTVARWLIDTLMEAIEEHTTTKSITTWPPPCCPAAMTRANCKKASSARGWPVPSGC